MNYPSRRSQPYKPKKNWSASVKYYAKSHLSKYPRIEQIIIQVWRVGNYLLMKIVTMVATPIITLRGGYVRGSDVDKVIWVNPQRIEFCSLREFEVFKYKGRVIGGNWDRLEKKFEELDIFIAFKEVFFEGNDWSSTIFYQRVLDEMKEGHVLWNCKDEVDLDFRCKYLTNLYHSIKTEGYKSQQELSKSQAGFQLQTINEEEVGVNIGRNGDLIFCDGAHRLAVAKLLGLQKIPVNIVVRHPEWVAFRKKKIILKAGGEEKSLDR